MGGKGSGGWRGSARKVSVLACLRLTVGDLQESGIISGEAEEILLSWPTDESEEDKATVRARAVSRTETKVVVGLTYTVHVNGEAHEVGETVHVVKANVKAGGQWWFRCPAVNGDEPCARRVGILYLPPSQKYFACRHCHDLAYPQTKPETNEGKEMEKIIELEDGANSPGPDDVEEGACDPDSPGDEQGNAQPLRSFYYIDHALTLLDPGNTTLGEDGRHALVDELLAQMLRDESLPAERFTETLPRVQSQAPEAFGAFAARALREGSFAPGMDDHQAYFPLHRLGQILRLYLVEDLGVEHAADLLLVDAAASAFVQSRILLDRATPLSPENGPPPKDEKLYRSQATAQQKLFLAAMDKLQKSGRRRSQDKKVGSEVA